jgi:tRNA G10  N-methylase Trm11
MQRQFPLFQSHIDLAHSYWHRLVKPGDLVIDATCGNGKDALFLAGLLAARIICLDIQQKAVDSSKELLKEYNHISFHTQCHSTFPEEIESESVKLIVYNLGYLPGGDKTRTTQSRTTIESLSKALKLIQPGGAVSVTCYPGHPEGAVEEEKILSWSENLAQDKWNVCFHHFSNRKQSPSLLIIQSSK